MGWKWSAFLSIPAFFGLVQGIESMHQMGEEEGRASIRQRRLSDAPISVQALGAGHPFIRGSVALDYRRVFVRGHFDHAREQLVGPVPATTTLAKRITRGNEDLGFHVITPFRLTGGESFLVDRGWIPIHQIRDRNPVRGSCTLSEDSHEREIASSETVLSAVLRSQAENDNPPAELLSATYGNQVPVWSALSLERLSGNSLSSSHPNRVYLEVVALSPDEIFDESDSLRPLPRTLEDYARFSKSIVLYWMEVAGWWTLSAGSLALAILSIRR